jgi:hypothetical protein
MKKLFMKICGYEESSGSLLIKFASDETNSQNPDDYPMLAYQPANMFPDITDSQTIKKRLAIAGKYAAEQQKIRENLEKDPVRVQELKNMVGSVEEYDVENDPDFNPPTISETA